MTQERFQDVPDRAEDEFSSGQDVVSSQANFFEHERLYILQFHDVFVTCVPEGRVASSKAVLCNVSEYLYGGGLLIPLGPTQGRNRVTDIRIYKL